MSTQTARSGLHAQAVVAGSRIARMTQWSLTDTVSETAWGDSDNGEFTVRKKARRECSGDLQGKYDTDEPPNRTFNAGDCVALVLWEDVNDADAYWYITEALIQSYAVTFNQDSKEVVGWTANWASSGRFYPPYASNAPSASAPSVPVS